MASKSWLILAALFCTLASRSVLATINTLSPSAVQDTLSESVPTAFAPADFNLGASDFAVEWVGAPISGVEARIGENTLQWVRVEEVLVLPRARLIVSAKDSQGGAIVSGGFAQGIAADGTAEIPVALVSGDSNPISVTVIRGGKEIRGEWRIRFKPKASSSGARVGIDASCSRYGVKARSSPVLSNDEWIYVGCRLSVMHAEGHRTSSLEMYVYWDNIGKRLKVDGADALPLRPTIWTLRVRSRPGVVKLSDGDHEVSLEYAIPEDFHYLALGVGIGPYSYQFIAGDANVSTATPLLTVYGSYFIKEPLRIVAFDATAFNGQMVTDFGIYLNTEYARFLDNRVALNLMLGAHAIGYQAFGAYYLQVSAPQGIEMVFSDAFGRNRNLTLGGFIYPPINDVSYYNIWLRWGSPAIFGELNYILWNEQLGDQSIYSRSFGVSVGFPIAKVW